ncbi:MAG: NAD(+)/NADH kinase [bacterium]
MNLAITGNYHKQEVHVFLADVFEWLTKRGVWFCVESELAEKLSLPAQGFPRVEPERFHEQADMVLSFGGDGTILSIARKIGCSGLPILGVKIGGMGFLAELAPEELYTSLPDILQGNYQVVERMVLAAEIEAENGVQFFALNDFVVDKGAVSRVIRLKTYIDDEFLNTYIGDGLIISSATGSTAYSLAAGGPILLPSMEAIIINPISPHSLGARPVVIPGDRKVKIKLEATSQDVFLCADGQKSRQLEPGKATTIGKADYCIRLVSYRHRSFYDILRAKLNWGEDVREAGSGE